GAKSRTPDMARVLNCPNCGAPLQAMRGTECSYCHTTVPAGSKDWAVASFQTLEREPRGPLLTSSVEEEGTSLPTVVDRRRGSVFGYMQQKDPELSPQRVEARVGHIFHAFHEGWVGRDPAKIRPFVSDNFFQSQLYWIDLYRASRCVNRTDGAQIT